jgi:nitrogen fixation/metabolism regulation signal transduction histidine kinase
MMFLAVILVVALMIPIIAILVDSPLGRSVARRLEGRTEDAGGGGGNLTDLQRKVDLLEGEVEELTRSLTATREELQFMQRLLEKPKHQPNA